MPAMSDVEAALGLRLSAYDAGPRGTSWCVEYLDDDGNVGLRREALEPEVRMWFLLHMPQSNWQDAYWKKGFVNV